MASQPTPESLSTGLENSQAAVLGITSTAPHPTPHPKDGSGVLAMAAAAGAASAVSAAALPVVLPSTAHKQEIAPSPDMMIAAARARLAEHMAGAQAARPALNVRVPISQRLVESTLAALALVVSAPVLAVLALLIKRGSPGPVVFRQTRMGMDLKKFRFAKFRTLYADARQRFPELYAYRYSSEELKSLRFKIENDPRVTPQGRWMRKSTLDELPNLWNVITGEMALVGPRPEIPEMLPYYKEDMLLKFTVRPGVTGLAQVSGRGKLGFHETVKLDVEYVRNRSMWLDMKIVLQTIVAIVVRDGAF